MLTHPALETAQTPTLRDIPWDLYWSLREVTDHQGVRLTYLDGELEIMSPVSELHEEAKFWINRLLTVWAEEREIPLRGVGSTTWHSPAKRAGAEGDESYKVGVRPREGVPDLVIEVVVSSAVTTNKLEVYARLGIKEVWVWWPTRAQLTIQTLVGDHYEVCSSSPLFPALDLETFVEHAAQYAGDQVALLRSYRATLR